MRGARALARWGARALGAMLLLALAAVGLLAATLPSVAPMEHTNPARTELMERHARAVGVAIDDYRLEFVALDAVSPLLPCALVKAEDRHFYEHRGIEAGRTWAALMRHLRGRSGGGASTITQQLVRNLYLGEDRTARRKAQELWLALRADAVLGKHRVLELYVNVIEFGEGVWGAQVAARRYFERDVRELDAYEATLLASRVQAPRRTLEEDQPRWSALQRTLLRRLRVSGAIGPIEERTALDRAARTEASVGAGTPLPSAIRRDAATAPAPADAPIPRAQLLEQHCGSTSEKS